MAEVTLDMLGEMVRQVLASQPRVEDKVDDLGRRVSSLEMAISGIHGDFAGQSIRIDKLDARLSRIETRLNLSDA